MTNIVRLPWWKADDSAEKFQKKIGEAQEQLQTMDRTTRGKLEARAFVSTVMVSCEAESMPAHVLRTEDAFRILTKIFHNIRSACPVKLSDDALLFFDTCEHDWPWQRYLRSGNSYHLAASCLSQMKQYLKALMFLCIYNKDKLLTAPLLKDTHAILMRGFQGTNSAIRNGCFRDFGITIEGAILIHEAAIASCFEDMLCRVQGEAEVNRHGGNATGSQDHDSQRVFKFPERCSSLLHDMSHIRPFANGDHWMCRIIMAFFMVAHDGFAFPVPIAPITTRTYQEFLHALFAQDEDHLQLHEDIAAGFRREKALLSAYVLECVCESLEELMRCN